MKLLLYCVMFTRASFQIRVVSQEVRLNASQLDELYNLFKVSRSLHIPRYPLFLQSYLGIGIVVNYWSYRDIFKSFHPYYTLV